MDLSWWRDKGELRIQDKTNTSQRDQVRALLLDLFPLTDRIRQYNPTFADVLHRCALACIIEPTTQAVQVAHIRDLLLAASDVSRAV